MAEKLNHNHNENEKQPEKNPYALPENKTHETNDSSHEQDIHHQREKLKQINEKIEREAKSSKEFEVRNESDKHKGHAYHQNTQYQAYTGAQSIKRVQRHLKPAERKFSKFIHNSKVEVASDITGATIARPNGLLYGGIFSLFSSLGLYFISKHYGYEYSFFVGILFFIGGFAFGLLVESVMKLLGKKT